jgi:hypothetical protein
MCPPWCNQAPLSLHLHVIHAMFQPGRRDATPSQQEGQGFESP